MQLVLPKGKVKCSPLFACSFLKLLNLFGMNIFLNQQSTDIPDQCSLQQLLTQVLNIPLGGLAVAIDQNVIPNSDWTNHLLNPGDKVMLIRATQGG
jgi:sulfur carrier protein